MMLLQRTRLLRTGGKQVIKWTAEGAVNNVSSQHLVFCNVRAYVSCQGYDSILLSVQHKL